VLAEAGTIDSPSDVTSVSVKSVAAPGYLSETVRVTLALSGSFHGVNETGGTPSVIVKLPSSNEGQRTAALENDGYEMEYKFYDEFATACQKARVPLAGCLHCAVAESGDEFVLVLEDLALRAGFRPGDQVAGMSYEEMAAGCVSLARLHAAFWGAELPSWLPTTNAVPLLDVVSATKNSWAKWHASDLPRRGKVSAQAIAAAEVVAANVEALAAMLEESPQTLCHHDTRPDNIFFGPGADGVEAVLLDWQLIGRGKGPIDVARMIICCFEPGPEAAVQQRELAGIYHAELLRHIPAAAAAAYPFEACWRDYRIGAAWNLWNAVLWVPGGAFYAPEDGSRTDRLSSIMQRYIGAMPDLDVASLFA